MRFVLAALCALVAVMLTAAPAHAQASTTRCFEALATHLPVANDQVTSPAKTVKTVLAPATPMRSQAPRLCTDPNQPGCHVDRPDAPRHRGGGLDLHHEPVVQTAAMPDLAPRPERVTPWSPAPAGDARPACARSPWRPPAA